MTSPLRVAILGAGRVGCSISRGLARASNPPLLLWTRSPKTAAAATASGLAVMTGPLPVIDADVLLLAVEDSAIEALARQLVAEGRVRPGAVVAHTAGGLDLGPLEPLALAGFATASFHPIVSVASRSTPLEGAWAGVAGDDVRLEELAGLLSMQVIRPTGDRARYHAAAAIVGNFPQVLLEATSRLLRECGLSEDEARRAFGPLLLGAARNAAEHGPAAGLTGPVVRGDLATVFRHLQALQGQPEVEAIYRAASLLAGDLAVARGAPNTDALRALLSGSED